MALLFFRKKRAQQHIGGNDPATSPVSDPMADKQTKFEALVHALHGDLYRYA
ncbi:MAG: sigma-70 family RNA polymerase sigma factor, partial [Aeromonas veronii]